jgi:hypothetical protein
MGYLDSEFFDVGWTTPQSGRPGDGAQQDSAAAGPFGHRIIS